MAYVIYNVDSNPGNFSRIAENITERDKHLHGTMQYHEISESEFNNLKKNLKTPSGWDGSNITYSNTSPINDAEYLEVYLKMVKETITTLLKKNYGYSTSNWQTYLDYLNTVDTSTINYPIDSWEKYCSDNSITYYSLWERP